MREFPSVQLSPESKLSDYFNVGLGLKQGEPLILFLLFVNDISDSIDFNNLTENDMAECLKYTLVTHRTQFYLSFLPNTNH